MEETTTAADARAARREAYQRRQRRALRVLPLLIVVVFIALAFTTNYIPSDSMRPLMKPGDHVLVMRPWLAYPMGRVPSRGDILTFRLTREQEQMAGLSDDSGPAEAAATSGNKTLDKLKELRENILIKRVIGLPGDKVQIKGKDVFINDQKLKEDYPILHPAVDDGAFDFPFAVNEPLTVPQGELFLLGDNRENSEDSRFWGTLKLAHVQGKFLRVLYHRELETDKKGDNGAPNANP